MLSEAFVEGIYDFGEDDWVQFVDIGHLLIEEEGTNEDLIRRGGAVAVELIRRGIMTPGFLGNHGFEAWNLTQDESIDRIRDEIEALAQTRTLFQPGDICWFRTSNYRG